MASAVMCSSERVQMKPQMQRKRKHSELMKSNECRQMGTGEMSPELIAQIKLLQSIKRHNETLREMLQEQTLEKKLCQPAIEGIVFEYPIKRIEPTDIETTKLILKWFFANGDAL